MRKKTVMAAIVISAFLLSLVAEMQVVGVAKANFVPQATIVSIYSPNNQTYSSSALTLKVTVNFAVTKDKWIAYSIDRSNNVTLSGIEYQIDSIWQGFNVTVSLPALSEGSHRLDIYAQSIPASYASPDNKTVFFAIDLNAADSWTSKAPMPTARAELGVVSLNGKIYAIGGFVSGTAVSTNEMYDPTTDTWTKGTSMPTARAGFGIAVFQNKIYCIGGATNRNQDGGYSSTNVNEIYDPATNTWTTGAPMSTARAFLNANVGNGKIYLIGGGNIANTFTFGPTALNEVYDPQTNSWTTKARIPNEVGYYASAVVGEKIYIIGGSPSAGTGRNYNQIYDTKTDTWSSGKAVPVSLSAGIYGMAAGAITSSLGQSRIFVIGGHDSTNGAYDLNEVYDVLQDNWTNAASFSAPRWELAVAEVNGSLYAIGGLTINANIVQQSNTNEQYTTSEYTGPIPSPSPSSSGTPSPSPTLSPTPIPTPKVSMNFPEPTPTQNPTQSQSPSPTLPSPSVPEFPFSFVLLMALVVMAVAVAHRRMKSK